MNRTLVFGATGAIGEALVRRLHERGEPVMLSGRDPERLEPLAEELGLSFVRADATDAEQVEAATRQTVEALGGLDGVVSCVGSVLLKPAHATTVEDWNQVLRTNLDSAFHVLRSAANAMMRTGGSVVLVSSAAAEAGLPNHEAIAAAKAGVAGLVRSAAATYANRDLRVNAVAPGLVRSRLTESIFASDMARKASQAMHALPRLGEPADVASAIDWLLSTEWVTGQVLGVDGGLATLKTRMKA